MLSGLPGVCESLIREFYSNVKIREDELDFWVRRHEFTLDAHNIDEVLGLEGLEEYEFINYKDRMLSLETVPKSHWWTERREMSQYHNFSS